MNDAVAEGRLGGRDARGELVGGRVGVALVELCLQSEHVVGPSTGGGSGCGRRGQPGRLSRGDVVPGTRYVAGYRAGTVNRSGCARQRRRCRPQSSEHWASPPGTSIALEGGRHDPLQERPTASTAATTASMAAAHLARPRLAPRARSAGRGAASSPSQRVAVVVGEPAGGPVQARGAPAGRRGRPPRPDGPSPASSATSATCRPGSSDDDRAPEQQPVLRRRGHVDDVPRVAEGALWRGDVVAEGGRVAARDAGRAERAIGRRWPTRTSATSVGDQQGGRSRHRRPQRRRRGERRSPTDGASPGARARRRRRRPRPASGWPPDRARSTSAPRPAAPGPCGRELRPTRWASSAVPSANTSGVAPSAQSGGRPRRSTGYSIQHRGQREQRCRSPSTAGGVAGVVGDEVRPG